MNGHRLTEAQEGLWYFQKIDPESPILNTGQYLDIRGPLDVAAFARAFERMARETDALALRVEETTDGPRQFVDEALRPRLDIADLTHLGEAAALAAMAEDSEMPVDPAKGPLSRFRLFILSPERALFYERIHHLAVDGYAMVLVTNRIAELYSALKEGREPSPAFPPLAQAWEEDEAYAGSDGRAADRSFWHDALAGTGEVGAMAAGTPVSARRFDRTTMQLDAAFRDRLRAVSKDSGVAWPDVLTALVSAYCARVSGTFEIASGVPHMGRLGSRAARVPCTLMNVLPFRMPLDEDRPLGDFLGQAAERLRKMRRHGRYRSEELRRELGLLGTGRRLFGPLVNVQPFDMPPKMAGLSVDLHILGAGAVDDITFTFRGDAISHLAFEVDSNPGLYTPDEAAAHGTRLRHFLLAAFDASSLAKVPTASPQEARRFVFEVNATDHALPETTLTALIEAQMRATPDAPAVRFEGETLTYAELDRRSSRLAGTLAALGAGPGSIVAVALPRSIDLVVALVGTLRAGAAYLPLDLDQPRERLQRLLKAAGPVRLLGDEAAVGLGTEETPLLHPMLWWEHEPQPPVPPAPDDMAYVIYTSGSTGEPKGVVVEHRAIVNRLLWMRDHYGFDACGRILQKTPATFDVSVWEFFLPLISGGTLVVAPPGAHRDPTAIARLIREEGVTTAHFVPSMLSAFLQSPAARGLRLVNVFCSGEELPAATRDRFHEVIDAELHNLYGPTEAAVDVSFWPAGPDDASSPVPIGFPVWNTRLLVLDGRMRPVPPGVAGDLYIGGAQLARFYLGRPDLTAERFVADPFRPGERLYRTGDLARWRQDGAVVFLGRSDHQVKIRGVRIELGEIEAAIMTSGLAREAGVLAREDRPGDKRIVAYLVPNEGYREEALRRRLAALLPDTMIPSAFVALDALPVTANGKLDRKALPAPAHEIAAGRPAQTETEKRLAGLYAEILGLDAAPHAEADFFDLGGDSLLAVRLMLRVEEVFGRDPGLGALFAHPRLDAMAAALDASGGTHDTGLGPVIRLAEGEPGKAPLFIVHPAGGLAWCYRPLAQALGDRPVYGLQAPTLDPDIPAPENLEALAALHVAEIAAIAQGGPVHLAGWSVGGILSQAIAAEFERQGWPVGLVALLDAYPCECWRSEPEPSEAQALGALLALAGHDPAAHADLVTREAVAAFLREAGGPFASLPPRALEGVVRTVLGTNALVRGHHHRRFGGRLTHVRAALDHQGTNLHPRLWEAHAGSLDVIEVPFRHSELISPAATAAIAPELARRLTQRGRKP